jgi:hypothetical protein
MDANFIGILFTQIALECFKEDIVGECVDGRPWVKPVLPPNSVHVILRRTCFLSLTLAIFNPQYLSSMCNMLAPIGILDGLY